MSSVRISIFLSTLITPTVCHTFSLRPIHPSSRSICIHVNGRGRGGVHQPDCFSLKDEMVFLQLVTFRKRFMGPRAVDLKGSLGMKGGLTAGGGDGRGSCERLRYK